MTTGKRIQAARKAKNLSQQELGKVLGVTGSMIGQYENDLRNPKHETLQKIADALEVPMVELLNEEEPDREYEMLCDTLHRAGFKIEQGLMVDEFIISHAYDEESEDERETVEYKKLVEIVNKILKDAEANKAEYIRKRLELELF